MTAAAGPGGAVARRALRGDLPRLVELLTDDVLGRELGQDRAVEPADQSLHLSHYAAAFEHIERDANQMLLVAEIGGRIVAMLQLTFIPGLSRRGAWRANIESVRVDSTLRGQGIGGWLVEQAVDIARRRGCRVAQLTSDKRRGEAHRFYGRLGFAATHEGFKRDLEPA